MKADKYLILIQQTVDEIESRLGDELKVSELSAKTGFSIWEFQRIFRAYIGDSLGDYIRGRRITMAAKELLQNKDKRILDIAVEFQFGSQEAFSRAFKKHFLVTPGQWREGAARTLSFAKPQLSAKRLQHIALNIDKNPKTVELPEKIFLGLSISFDSTFGTDNEVYKAIRKHWLTFDVRRSEISHVIRGKSYGLISGMDGDLNSETLVYTASCEVGRSEVIPEGMTKHVSKSQKYAQFDVRGVNGSCQIVADYIYGIWLPQADFQRDLGLDFELFDHQLYRPESSDSVHSYFLPIR